MSFKTPATDLKSATTIINISGAIAPTADQILTAIDETHAEWRDNAAAAGVPGGSPTQIQFNNAGVFDGVIGSAVDTTNGKVTLNGTGTAPLRISTDSGSGTVGGELITDPTIVEDFMSVVTAWVGGDGWSWANPGATHTPGEFNYVNLIQQLTVVTGQRYKVAVTVTGCTTGSYSLALGSSGNFADNQTGNWSGEVVSADTGSVILFSFVPTFDFDGTLTSVSFIPISVLIPVLEAAVSNNLTFEARLTNLNVFLGLNSGRLNLGGNNVGVGQDTLISNLTGTSNTAIGFQALYCNTTGGNNTALGVASLFNNINGGSNIALGEGALASNIDGGANLAVGYNAFFNNTHGNNGIAIGYEACFSSTNANANTAVGFRSMRSNTDGSGNTAYGWETLFSNITGQNNDVLGHQALYYNTSGSNNTAIGFQSLFNNLTGEYNVALGRDSLRTNTTGGVNTAIGVNSLHENTVGTQNTSVGCNSLYANIDGNYNTALGYESLRSNITGAVNTSVGVNSLHENTTGSYNTSLGCNALFSNTTGENNNAFGYQALRTNTTGSENLAIGKESLLNSTTAINNIGIGNYTLNNTTLGSDNTAVGLYALYYNTEGACNTAIGLGSLQGNITGNRNTAIGTQALIGNTIGYRNVAIGQLAGFSSAPTAATESYDCTFIGYASGLGSATQIHNSTAIGANALVETDNTIVLGDVNVTDIYAGSTAGATVNAGKYKLSILNTAPSSATDTGVLGEVRITADFIYVCIATDTWVRAALTTWT